jgi:hypothetical protein
MLNYPPEKTAVCKYCGAVVRLERQGDGHPGLGRLRYWYTTDHACPESERAVREHEAERDQINAILNAGG